MLVCDACGHVAPHDGADPKPLPTQPSGTTARVVVSAAECRNVGCHCNVPVWRPLSEHEAVL